MSYAAFAERIASINDLLCAVSVMQWDARTMMPDGGAVTRGQQMATLSVAARDMLVADETLRLIDAAERETQSLAEDAPERRALAQARRAVLHHRRIPPDLQRRRTELRTVAQAAWIKARAESNFALFRPHLEAIVAMSREYAEAAGYATHPYDAMVGLFEPGETAASLTLLFDRLRMALVPLGRAVGAAAAGDIDVLAQPFAIADQEAFGRLVAERFGYDFSRGRLDPTVHPFEISFTRNDVRITTRYNANHLVPALQGTMHETGHGLYEQGIDPAFTRTALATDLIQLYAVGGASFGAHESQSRLYENHVGRSRPFWAVHYPLLQARFPAALGSLPFETFHRTFNTVRPGLIRVEADELTYDLHIMLRVEIEMALMDGSLAVRDLPEAWNALVKRDLGLDVPDDRLGVLQDIHWSSGYLGSFPTYTIGNVMAAQLFDVAKADPIVSAGLDDADYGPLRAWLGEAVHRHGRRFTRDELLIRATGRALDPAPYLAYLDGKYRALYGVAA